MTQTPVPPASPLGPSVQSPCLHTVLASSFVSTPRRLALLAHHLYTVWVRRDSNTRVVVVTWRLGSYEGTRLPPPAPWLLPQPRDPPLECPHGQEPAPMVAVKFSHLLHSLIRALSTSSGMRPSHFGASPRCVFLGPTCLSGGSHCVVSLCFTKNGGMSVLFLRCSRADVA